RVDRPAAGRAGLTPREHSREGAPFDPQEAFGIVGAVTGKKRLIVFCSEIETDLDRVREAIAEAVDGAQVTRTQAPDAFGEAGWMAVAVTLSEPVRVGETLCAELETITGLFSRALQESVLGVAVDPSLGQARACFHSPGVFPRSTEGKSFHVIRQAASWIEA